MRGGGGKAKVPKLPAIYLLPSKRKLVVSQSCDMATGSQEVARHIWLWAGNRSDPQAPMQLKSYSPFVEWMDVQWIGLCTAELKHRPSFLTEHMD